MFLLKQHKRNEFLKKFKKRKGSFGINSFRGLKFDMKFRKQYVLYHYNSLFNISNNDSRGIKMLIKEGVDLEKENLTNCTPLTLCCLNDNINTFKLLIKHKADINGNGRNDRTILFECSLNNKPKFMKLLIDGKVNLDKVNRHTSYTALMAACCWNHKECAKLLIEAGANKKLRDLYGRTAFCVTKNDEIMELLK